MDFIKKLFNPKQIPFYKKEGNEKYNDILKFQTKSNSDKFIVNRIIQEARFNNQTVVSTLDNTMEFLFINKYGTIKTWNLKNTKFKNSTNKLFERCNKFSNQIIELGDTNNKFLNENGIRLTYLTDNGNFSVFGNYNDLMKTEIFAHTIVHHNNLTWIINPKRYDKILKNELKKAGNIT